MKTIAIKQINAKLNKKKKVKLKPKTFYTFIFLLSFNLFKNCIYFNFF